MLDISEDGLQLNASVARPVTLEPSRGLLELALAAGPVATTCVMPGDGDVHEPL